MRTGGHFQRENAEGLYTDTDGIGKPRNRGRSLTLRARITAMEARALPLNLVTALLIVGGVLLLMAWAGPGPDVGMMLLGLLLAVLHGVAALGTALRRRWGRLVGLLVGWIGLLGSGAVLVALAAGLPSIVASPGPLGGSWLLVLLIPAAMVAAYLVIVVVLIRSRGEFEEGLSRQAG